MALKKSTRGRKPIVPCKGVKTSRPNRCRRRTACKVAKGASRTFCRKKHNKTLRSKTLRSKTLRLKKKSKSKSRSKSRSR